LDAILLQLHFRYELGFIPPAVDGKRHELRVEFTKTAKAEHKGVRLRYRPEIAKLLARQSTTIPNMKFRIAAALALE